ncbi:MAG: ATP-binding protein [bacterium]|nr:ATP-binding protein [bacterium]
MHNGMVKVVTGIRRSGKSFLLFKIFRRYLRELGVGDDHVIAIALDQRQNRRYRDPDAILQYIEALITDGSPYYIMIDEVQMLAEFEEVINSLLHLENADVYVTGSNSKFLSKDVITEFRGRGDEVHVYPLSFREYMQVYEGDVYHCWSDYVVYGGLPLAALMRSEARKVQYLSSLFAETYLKDIIERNHIVKTQELEDLINVLASSIGSLTNANKIAATYKTKLHSSLSANTIRQYIDYLEDAYIVSAAQRYDVKGRKYIGALVKYYFEDVGLRNARLGFRQIEETHLMENVVYNELRGRGYSVDVGIVELRRRNAEGASVRCQREIDFVANLGSRRYYIQSAFSIPDMDKWEQEKASLCGVKDAFKKIVLVKDVRAVSRDESGIMTMSIYDFLLNEDSLEL